MSNNCLINFQQEKIYFIDEEIDRKYNTILITFFNELVKRKRNDDPEDGLQASIVIFKDRVAAKVNENNGRAPHIISEVNLVRFLKEDNGFYRVEDATNVSIYQKEMFELLTEGLTIKVLDCNSKLVLLIDSSCDISSLFQIKTLQKIILICQELLDEQKYQSVEIGLYTFSINIDAKELNSNHFDKLMHILMKEKERILNNDAKQK